MKRLQAVFPIQTSQRGRTVRRSSTNHLGGGTAGTDAVGTIPSTDELSRVDYCGNMVYDRGERRLLLENGYVTFDLQTNAPSYHFYLRDHLGNNRVVMAQNGTVEQVTHYYPFGGVMRESTNPISTAGRSWTAPPVSMPTTSGRGCISPTGCSGGRWTPCARNTSMQVRIITVLILLLMHLIQTAEIQRQREE